MARKVFFSFHYGRDISCANVVRNSWVTKDKGTAGFLDASLWDTGIEFVGLYPTVERDSLGRAQVRLSPTTTHNTGQFRA